MNNEFDELELVGTDQQNNEAVKEVVFKVGSNPPEPAVIDAIQKRFPNAVIVFSNGDTCEAGLDESTPIRKTERSRAVLEKMRRTYGSLLHVASFAMKDDYFPDIFRSTKPRFSTAKKYNPCPCGSGLKFKFCCMKKFR